jgi:hypothetical protein
MALYLSNSCPFPTSVSVSLLIYDPTCKVGGQPWRKEGWWNIKYGQTIKPDALNVNLTTVNAWVGIYAVSGIISWEGTGNAWFQIPASAAFNQCGEDETNCTNWVDYHGVEFSGDSDYVVYISLYPQQITGAAPSISITTGEYPIGLGFSISAAGFVPGSTVTVGWKYVFFGGILEEQNSSAATFTVNPDGTFGGILAVPMLEFAGTLTVQATDSGWGLEATESVVVA